MPIDTKKKDAPHASPTPATATATATDKELKTPRERFATVGVNRVNNVIHALEVLENVSERSSYEYNDAEAKKIIATIRAAVDKVETRFNDALSGKVVKAVKAGFTI
jgi:hypothetical protein